MVHSHLHQLWRELFSPNGSKLLSFSVHKKVHQIKSVNTPTQYSTTPYLANNSCNSLCLRSCHLAFKIKLDHSDVLLMSIIFVILLAAIIDTYSGFSTIADAYCGSRACTMEVLSLYLLYYFTMEV